jgi:hypothetical protein
MPRNERIAIGGLIIALVVGGFAVSKASGPGFVLWLIASVFWAIAAVLIVTLGRDWRQGHWRADASLPPAPAPHPPPAAETPAPAPPTLTPTAPASALGDDIHRTPEELWAMFDGLTDMQAQRLIAPFIGRPMVIADFVRSVTPWRSSWATVYAQRELRQIALHFTDTKWLPTLEALKMGDAIVVRGEIEIITAQSLWLDNCVIRAVGHDAQAEADKARGPQI